MASFTFTLPNGQPFEVKGPPGLTFDQAKSAFDQQADTGALVGFKPGDILNAAKQAGAGVAAAQAAVGQALSGITGSLGAGIPGAAGQVGGLNQIVSSAKSVATSAIDNVTKAISSTPLTNPINTANFAQELPALASIGPLSQSTVTGVLAQAKNIVGQAANKLSNNKGVGSFGFDVKQLETAGILKPGTSSFITQGAASLSSVLKSPSVFTGKDGVKSIDGLLNNPQLQSGIQQNLMADGAAGLTAQGISLDKLGSGAPGMMLNAAKSLPDATAFAKGLPLPPDVKALMNTNLKDGAFAANLTDLKIPDAFKAEDIPVPASNTVNRETLDAAATRILGNPKIPTPNYGPQTA